MTATNLVPLMAAYLPALVSLTVLSLIVPVQSFLTAPLAFLKGGQSPGKPLAGDHSDLSFRVLRTHANSVESLPAFGFAVLMAILVGVSPSLVNWLAVIHVICRVAFWAVYYSGIGKVAGGPRTICYVGGLVTNIVLALAAIVAIAA